MSSLRKKTPKISEAGNTGEASFALGPQVTKLVSALPQNRMMNETAGPKATGSVMQSSSGK